jgi:hypothetical protein
MKIPGGTRAPGDKDTPLAGRRIAKALHSGTEGNESSLGCNDCMAGARSLKAALYSPLSPITTSSRVSMSHTIGNKPNKNPKRRL